MSNPTQQAAEKKAIRTAAEIKWKAIVNELQSSLPPDRYRALLAAQEKGASAFVTAEV